MDDTPASKTDPEARLARINGRSSQLAYPRPGLMESRHGLVVDARLTQANGYAERSAALYMLGSLPGSQRVPLGADRGYHTRDFGAGYRELDATPHVAPNTTNRSSRIDARTTGHPGDARSQRTRRCIEEIFGWMKTVGVMRKTRHRGQARVGWAFLFTAAASNRVRMRNLATAR